MNVFISWSGEKSKEIASVFERWIPSVIQTVKTYFSPDDTEKWARWANTISEKLKESDFALVCLTNENLESPWLLFEAGALSKNNDKGKVTWIN